MRPASIVNFERVVWLSVLLTIVSAAVDWDREMAQLSRHGVGEATVIVVLGLMILLTLVLAWLAARRRSQAARWIYVAWTVIGLAASVPSLPRVVDGGALAAALNLATLALAVLSLVLLFTAGARAWFAPAADAPAAD